MPGRVALDELGRAVGGPVGDHQHLEVAEGLGEQRVQAVRQLFLLIVGGDHDADQG